MAHSYLVLARKWRPQRFEDLLGQTHVARALANAIRKGRVAHAFLFAGVRGVGKTSAARILAKALTCRAGPTPEPCGACDACTGVTNGSAIDVQEIDGASNNSVEDVRRLRENVAYQPSSLRYKIYVIDEVHMLSASAFNALLKTLEEPPPHVKFIFATTEPHKLPVTIVSRCQHYDFRRITARQIGERLGEILRAEAIAVDPAAVRAIAEEAGGSMRDALSLLDQVLAAYPEGASAADVTWLLGVAPQALVARAAAGVVDRDVRAALEAMREADESGFDLPHFARSLLRYFRELIVLATCGDAAGLTDLADADEAAARRIAGRTTVPHLHRLFGLASRLVDDLARSPLPRVHFDVALARMATADTVVPIADVLARLERLPAPARDGGAPAPRPPAGIPAPPRPAPPPPQDAAPASRDPGVGDSRGPLRSGDAPGGPERTRGPLAAPGGAARADADAALPARDGPPAGSPASPVAPPAVPAIDAALWERLVAEAAAADGSLAGILVQAVPTELSARRVRVAFPEGATAAELLRQPRWRESFRAAAGRVFGAGVSVEIDDRSSEAARAIATRAQEQRATEERLRQEILDHPAVRETLRAFAGSRVVDVRAGTGGGQGGKER